MGARRAERQILIEATPGDCFDALLDFERYPEWQRAVKSVEILGRDGDGRPTRVAFELDAKLRAVHYTLEYAYEEPHLLTWRYVDGDVKDVDGEFVLEDQGDELLEPMSGDAAAYFSRPGRGSWTASSCWRTCCTPSACPRRRRAARSS